MKKLWFALVFLSFGIVWCNEFSWDFSDCEIKEILFAISLDSGLSVVADDTVDGKGSLRFSGEDFDAGFESFLRENRLYVEKQDAVWTVSKFKMTENEMGFCLDAYDLTPAEILEKISQRWSLVLAYDELPAHRISVHLKNLKEMELLAALGLQFGNYEMAEVENGVRFVSKNVTRMLESNEAFVKLEKDENGYVLDVSGGRFTDVLEKIFDNLEGTDEESKCFCLLDSGDYLVARTRFSSKNLENLLITFCGQNDFSFELKDGIYYFFKTLNKKDELLFGAKKWQCFDLKYVDVQNFLPLVLKNVGNVEISVLGGNEHSFFAKVNDLENEQISKLISQVDIKKSVYVVNLKHIKPGELLEHLPPFVDKKNLVIADDKSCVYFEGTEEAYNNLCEELLICDKPEIRITYDLLILQYEETKQNNWTTNFNASNAVFGQRNGVSAQLGNVLNLNFNVVSAFGLDFATKLQSSLEENKTRVFVDTTLQGISGKEINFKNTNTYRYRDNNLDPDTGKPIYSGVTKEIVSGIQLDIVGWVSGEGNITSRVTASVSRQGTDTSSLTGNPPATSEKIVTTEVCTRSGEPVILSGLLQDSESIGESGVPIASKVPFAGALFKSKNINAEKNQMIIYLVPHIENSQDLIIEKESNENNEEKNKARIEQYEKILGLLEKRRKEVIDVDSKSIKTNKKM